MWRPLAPTQYVKLLEFEIQSQQICLPLYFLFDFVDVSCAYSATVYIIVFWSKPVERKWTLYSLYNMILYNYSLLEKSI